MARAFGRLVVMALVTATVLLTTTAVGLPATAVLGLSITMAGLVGMIGLARRGSRDTAAVLAGQLYGASYATPVMADGVASLDPDSKNPVMAVMAPGGSIDPESLMPRWRRPSLLAARRADPMRVGRSERSPLRFGTSSDPSPNRRIVRYAVVALLDRPDEVTGHQVSDLMSGDEVEVLDKGGAFWQVLCPDGLRGWVHRTTLGVPGTDYPTFGRRVEASEPDDILTAVLSARGIQ